MNELDLEAIKTAWAGDSDAPKGIKLDKPGSVIEALVAEVEALRAALNQTEHVVVLTETGWNIEHLVECRR